jgi:hypothetical protein
LLAQSLHQRRDRMLVTLASVVPDVDGLGLVVSEQLYADWHHKLAHGAVAAVVVTSVVALWTRSWRAALLALVAFHAHVVMDLAGSGPGWPIVYAWPWSSAEWLPSWQWDLASWQNALFGMVTTLLCLACARWFARTPVELFSCAADARVVATVRARWC